MEKYNLNCFRKEEKSRVREQKEIDRKSERDINSKQRSLRRDSKVLVEDIPEQKGKGTGEEKS